MSEVLRKVRLELGIEDPFLFLRDGVVRFEAFVASHR